MTVVDLLFDLECDLGFEVLCEIDVRFVHLMGFKPDGSLLGHFMDLFNKFGNRKRLAFDFVVTHGID